MDAGGARAGGLLIGVWGTGRPTTLSLADAGTVADAGALSDAGSLPTETGLFTTLVAGPAWSPPDELITPGNGLPSSFIDAQHDAAGNLWVVSASNLYLRRAGFSAWESFGHGDGLSSQEILSVGGGVSGTAWVGYHGLGDGDATDPPSWWYTGGADKVVLSGANLDVTHYALVSPPGTYSQYPQGRFKLRRTLRVYPTKTGPFAGDAWFGANHGCALVNAAGVVLEHHHPLDCVWDPVTNDCTTTHEGDVPAVGFYPEGDVLFGGSYGIGSVSYDDGHQGNFWGAEPIHNKLLFQHPLDPNANGSEDIVGVAAASDGSVWAASQHSGLAHLHSDGTTVDIFQATSGLPTNDLEDMAVDNHDRMWLATTQDGLFVLDLHTGVISQAPGLPSDVTRRIMFEQTNAGREVTVVVSGGIGVYVIQ